MVGHFFQQSQTDEPTLSDDGFLDTLFAKLESYMTHWKSKAYIISLSHFLAALGFGCSLPFVPLFVQTLGVTGLDRIAVWSGLLSTARGVTMALSSPLWGLISDRHGRKLIVIRGMWGCALFFGAVLLASNVQQLLVIFLIQGLFSGILPASTSLMASISPKENVGGSFGLLQMAMSGGIAGGTVLGGFVADLFGYRSTYALSSILFALAGVLVTTLIKEEYGALASRKPLVSDGRMSQILLISRGSGQLGVVLLVMLLVQCARASLSPVLPLLVQSLQTSGRMVAANTGAVIGVTELFIALAAVVTGRIGDKIGYRASLILSTLAAIFFYLLQPLTSYTLMLILVRAGLGICLAGVMPSANALLSLTTPPERLGTAYGLVATIFAIGNLLGPLLGAGITAAFGLSLPFFVASSLFAGAGLITWVGIKPFPRVCPPEA